jgi:uncharacterized linocin/CFP29 family protein
MDILKKNLAPISESVWNEILNQTKTGLNNIRTARKFVDIDGPHGPEFAAVSTGRFKTPRKEREHGRHFGIREVLPLVEIRMPLELELSELENLERGAKDVDLEKLDIAVKNTANFEDNIIYNGFKEAEITGLEKSSKYPQVKLPAQTDDILKLLGIQINRLRQNYVEGPYSLVLAEKYWLELINITGGYPVIEQIKNLLNGDIIVNDNNDKSFLISKRGGDYELTIGQDTTLGYEAHDAEKLKLHLSESFTFRVLSPEAIVIFSPNKN